MDNFKDTNTSETEDLNENNFDNPDDVLGLSVIPASTLKPANLKRVSKPVVKFQPGPSDKEIRKAQKSSEHKIGGLKDPPDTRS